MLRGHLDKLLGSICSRTLFFQKPIVHFVPEVSHCCAFPLQVQKTRRKTVVTLDIGRFVSRETILSCRKCGKKYTSTQLQEIVPPWCNFGYDVVVYVGKAFFLRCRNDKEIIKELWSKNITISSSQIAYLAKKFIIYLALAHRHSRKGIKEALGMRGGYILHLDATCEGASPHLMSGLDGISEIVLDNIKLPSESAEKIIPFLKKIKEEYGDPRALVHDMGKGILSAVEQVFPGKPDYICHFHFLRDIGKDLFEQENDVIRKCLKNYAIQGLLQKEATKLKKIIDHHPGLDARFATSLKNGEIAEWALEETPVVAAYSMILWALDGKKQGNGYGFPFDRPYLVFYQRLQIVYDKCKELQKIYLRDNQGDNKPFVRISHLLQPIIYDTPLRTTALQMQEKTSVFDKLRDAMRIADPEQNWGLNDEGEDSDIKTIEKGVKEFHRWLLDDDTLSKNKDYQKMIEQIEKYWQKLFADPITVDTPHGKVTIQPQRTNNILEQFFRDIKRRYRKKSGTNSMGKILKAMLADTPLVKNLENQEYLDIILGGKATLEERFAEIDAKIVREELKKSREDLDKIPSKLKGIIKKSHLPQILLQLFIKQTKN